MTDREKFLTSLDVNKITSDGKYSDREKGIFITLTYDDVLFLRFHNKNRKIAQDYEFRNIKPLEASSLNINKQAQGKKKKNEPRRIIRNSDDFISMSTKHSNYSSSTPIPEGLRTTKLRDREAEKTQIPPGLRPTQLRNQELEKRQIPEGMKKTVRRPDAPERAPGEQLRRPKKKKYSLTRDNKYTGKKHKGISFGFKEIISVAGVILLCTAFINHYSKNQITPINIENDKEIVTTIQYDVAGYEDEISYDSAEDIEQKNTQDLIVELSNIYHLHPEKVYTAISNLTNNFSDPSYTENFTVENVSCKGSGQLFCDSEEEILLYTIRILKQDPERFNLSSNEMGVYGTRIDKNKNYIEIIEHYAKVLGEDPCLIYGIMQAETGWDSDLLNNYHNPAGLKLDGEWWQFDTIEEGIIELILEVQKYRRLGANTVEEIAEIHCPLDDPNDINKVNIYWVDNVKEGMASAQSIYKNYNKESSMNRQF